MTIKFRKAVEAIEDNIEFDYVEQEGDVVRFDIGDNSFWLNQNCTIDNLETWPKSFQKKVQAILATC